MRCKVCKNLKCRMCTGVHDMCTGCMYVASIAMYGRKSRMLRRLCKSASVKQCHNPLHAWCSCALVTHAIPPLLSSYKRFFDGVVRDVIAVVTVAEAVGVLSTPQSSVRSESSVLSMSHTFPNAFLSLCSSERVYMRSPRGQYGAIGLPMQMHASVQHSVMSVPKECRRMRRVCHQFLASLHGCTGWQRNTRRVCFRCASISRQLLSHVA